MPADLLFPPGGSHVMGQLLDRLPLAILVADATQTVSFVNAPYRLLFGFALNEELVGQPASAILARTAGSFRDPSVVVTVRQLAEAGHPELLGLRIVLHDGRTVERDVVVLGDGSWLVTYRDVTEGEQARAEAEGLARIPFHNPNPVLQLQVDGTVLFANQAASRLREGFADDELALGREARQAIAQEAMASGQPHRIELQLGTRFFDTYILPYPADGYVNVYLSEVTARRAAEAETRRQREFYENILTYLPADVVAIDPDLRYRYINPQALRNLDLHPSIVGQHELEYAAQWGLSSDVAEQRQQVMRQAIAEKRQIRWEEAVIQRETASLQYFARFAQPVFDDAGTPTMLISYGIDITPIREAEQVLARSEKQYRDLMQYSQALICTHDLNGRVLTVNPAIVELLGVPPDRLVGRNLADVMLPEDRPIVATYLADLAASPEAAFTGVMRVLPRHANRPRYLLYHNIRVEEAGYAPYVIGYAQDISERVRAERAMEKAKQAAEAAARARENFLASMSHEIRTPLNGVLGMAALLDKTPLTNEQQQYVSLIRTAGRSLLVLLNDVLDMSKISSGKLELAAVPFDLRAVLRDMAEPQALRAAEKGIKFRFVPLKPLPDHAGVIGDAQRLSQVLTNLLSNAVKFTERGSVTLECRLQHLGPETLTVTFLVVDTGIGILPAQQEKIFDEFTQAYTDTAQRFGGTGLGLAISERLVGALGGRLVLTSAPGEGTTFGFTLTLPRTELAPAEAAPVADGAPSISGLRVLLAEDHAVNRLLARLMLDYHGAIVTEVVNGAEAVELVQLETFDVVLMDIQMPVMNGLEATAAIRALPDPVKAQLPILALTANAFRSDTERYLAAGMNGCLTKPFEEEELLRLLGDMSVRPAQAAQPTMATPEVLPASGFPATALRLGHGQMAFVIRIVQAFLATTPPLLAQLAAATPAQAATVTAIAHQLAPAARVLDATETADLLKELEALPAADPQWDDLRYYVVQELEELLGRLTAWHAAT
jgi:PAS domain S-box-containing protein